MIINLLEISYTNIRNFKDVKIDLVNPKTSKNYKMSLIMMPNGTGKTTTLDLLRILFNQQGEKISEETIKSFKPLNSNAEKGMFGVKLMVDNKIYGLYLEFDYILLKAKYKTSKAALISGGMKYGWSIEEIKNEFTPKFINLFVFDGELAKEMLEINKNEAENAIKYLYNIDKIDTINTTIDNLLYDKSNSKNRKSTTTSESGLTRYKNLYSEYKSSLYDLESQLYNINNDINIDSIELKKLENMYSDLVEEQKDLNLKKNEYENEINNEKKEKERNIKLLLNNMKTPEELSDIFENKLNTLSGNLKTLKLPKNVSKQFFHDLANNDVCICGRCISNKEKHHIIEVADSYLGEENIGFLNAMKENISGISSSKEFVKIIDNIMSNTENIITIQNKIDRIINSINDNGGTEVRKLNDKIYELKKRIDNLKNRKNIIESTSNDDLKLNYKNNINKCNIMIKEVEEKYNEALGVKNYLETCNLLKRYITDISSKTLSKLKDKIIIQTNERIRNVIDRDKIQIDKISGGISIKDKAGVSVGQALSVVYCFLGTMFERSLKKIPFIIDSPCNSLDLEVRSNIAKIIPKLFNQVIVFIISSEKAGFVENLEVNKDEIQYTTIYKKDINTEEVTIQEGYTFFNNFQEVD